jgi:hypothetical protein
VNVCDYGWERTGCPLKPTGQWAGEAANPMNRANQLYKVNLNTEFRMVSNIR